MGLTTTSGVRGDIRTQFFAAYGSACACCGVDDPEVLTVDHEFNDGYVRRSEYGRNGAAELYALRELGWPPDRGIRVLCENCNAGRACNGGICPHTAVEGVKRCSRCQTTKPRSEFHRFNRAADKLQAECKACMCARANKRNHGRREEHLAECAGRVATLKEMVIEGYGGKCSECPQDIAGLLILVRTDGRPHTGNTYTIRRGIIRLRFPATYTLRCRNCQKLHLHRQRTSGRVM